MEQVVKDLDLATRYTTTQGLRSIDLYGRVPAVVKFVDNNRRASIKNSSTESYKVYSAIAEFENGITSQDIKNIEKLEKI